MQGLLFCPWQLAWELSEGYEAARNNLTAATKNRRTVKYRLRRFFYRAKLLLDLLSLTLCCWQVEIFLKGPHLS